MSNCNTKTDKPKTVMLVLDPKTWNGLNTIARSKISRLKPYTENLLKMYVEGKLVLKEDIEK